MHSLWKKSTISTQNDFPSRTCTSLLLCNFGREIVVLKTFSVYWIEDRNETDVTQADMDCRNGCSFAGLAVLFRRNKQSGATLNGEHSIRQKFKNDLSRTINDLLSLH